MPEQRTQHLYLLFDDWHSGYSIRKVSLSRRSGKELKEGAEPAVPEVFMRIRAARGFPSLFTSAFGAKIMVMHPGMADDTPGIPMIDVQEQALTFGPEPCNYYAVPIFFPVGVNRLFVMDMCKFDCYLWTTPERHSEDQEPCGSLDLPRLPFDRLDVVSYGVHVQPNGCSSILVSTTKSISSARTFIFDTTKEEEYVWKPYGDWVLPFTGRGHYDTSLGGFVGLSTDGYLCCITMAASTTGAGLDTGKTLHPSSPDVKRTKEKLNTEGQHVSATLVHMHQGKFCLVECVAIGRNGQELRESWAREFKVPLGSTPWDCVGGGPQGGRCMYRLKTFSLYYDIKGDCLTLKHCKVRCYSLPHEARIGSVCIDPVAFWL